MGSIVTTYDVMTRYLMNDQVSGGAQRMTTQLTAAKNASTSLKSTLLGLAGAVGIGFGLHAVYEKIKGANMEMLNLQKRVTGTHFAFTQWGKDVSTTDRMKESMAVAAEMGAKLEDIARHLHLELDPVATIYNSMAASAGKLGMSQEDTLKLVEQLAAATRVYGSDAQTVAMTVSRALETGGIRGVDNFAKMLRQKLNLKEEGKNLAPAEMLRRLSGGLGGTIEAAQMMGGGLEGTMADLHREGDALVRTLTGPAFKSIAGMLHQWVEYSAKNREHVEAIAKSVAGGLVTGLTAVKDITVFLCDHWKSMAALWAANKGFGMLSMGGSIGGAAGAAGVGSRARLGALSIVASAVYIGSTEIVDWLERRQAAGLTQAAVAGPATMEQLRSAAAGMTVGANAEVRFAQSKILVDAMTSSGLATREGGVNRAALLAAMEAANIDPNRWESSLRVQREAGDFGYKPELIVDALESFFERAVAKPVYDMMQDIDPLSLKNWGALTPKDTGKKGDNKVTINRIEVVSDDPDRFAFGLDEVIHTAIQRGGLTPGAVAHAFPGGRAY